MNRLLPLIIFFCLALCYGGQGQCNFIIPDNYGLICDQAIFLCGNEMQDYQGRLPEDLSPGPQPSPICMGNGRADNIMWFSFVPDDTNLEIEVIYDNCVEGDVTLGIGLQVGMYNTCELDDNNRPLGTLDCLEAFGTGSLTLMPDPAMVVPGELYYIYVDGIGRTVCDFEFDIISGVCTDVSPPGDECPEDCGVSNEFSDYLACTDIPETYTFSPSGIFYGSGGCSGQSDMIDLDSIICIDWQITPDVPASNYDVVSVTNYFDSLNITSEITINWNAPGEYSIRPVINYNPLYSGCGNGCLCTDDVVFKVNVSKSDTIVLPTVELCPGDCFDFCGETYCSSTSASCDDRASCTITQQEIIVKDITFVDIGDHYICEDNCFIFNGVPYCIPSQFSIPGVCDTSYVFELFDLEINLAFDQAEPLIDCNNSDANISVDITTSYPNDIKTFWLNEVGDTVSFTTEYLATDEGNYTFYAVPTAVEGCAVTISHTVDRDDDTPDVVLVPPSLDCTKLTDNIQLNTQDAIATVDWTGPNGFLSSDISPEVSEGGDYTAMITGVNGCKLNLMTTVAADFRDPIIMLAYDNFTCSDVLPIAQYSSDLSVISTEWTLPDNSTSSDEVLNLADVGAYTLTVTSSNGCTGQEFFTVNDLSYDPSLNLSEDYIWRCNDTERIIDISLLVDPNLKYTWSTIEGALISEDKIFIINGPGSYVLRSEDEVVGCIGLDTVNIIEDANPFLDIIYETNQPSCRDGIDGSLEIITHDGGQGPYAYNYNGDTYMDVSEIDFSVGIHTISTVDFFGCEVSKTFEITNPELFEITTDAQVTISYGSSKTFIAEVSIEDDQLDKVTWTDMEGNFLAEGLEVELDGTTENITITAEDIHGCIATANVRVVIDYNVDIHYPSIFSPNNDGNNDFFMLWNAGFPSTMDEFLIYDRSGELIYQEVDFPFNQVDAGWDGRFNDQELQPGVFVFLIKYTLGNGEQAMKSGSITLIK